MCCSGENTYGFFSGLVEQILDEIKARLTVTDKTDPQPFLMIFDDLSVLRDLGMLITYFLLVFNTEVFKLVPTVNELIF